MAAVVLNVRFGSIADARTVSVIALSPLLRQSTPDFSADLQGQRQHVPADDNLAFECGAHSVGPDFRRQAWIVARDEVI